MKANGRDAGPRESTVRALRAELRLRYFHATRLGDEPPLHFDTGRLMFYGHKVDGARDGYDSEGDENTVQPGYVGLLLFYSGETYIGELDAQFRPHGEGMLLFSVGAVLRGGFVCGRAHGYALISLQTEVEVLARLDTGILHRQTLKIDHRCRVATELRYSQGRFVKYETERPVDESLTAHIRDCLGTNPLPDSIAGFMDGGLHFGTFIAADDSLYYGFVRNGKPVGWGAIFSIAAPGSAARAAEALSWRLANNSISSGNGTIAVGLNQDGNVVFGLESAGVLTGEIGVYYPRDNLFQRATVRGGAIEFEAECTEGIQRQFVRGLYLQHTSAAQLPVHQVNTLPTIFDLTYFNDRFFFYLHGLLKAKSRALFQDNLQLGRGDFGQLSGVPDADTEAVGDSLGAQTQMPGPTAQDGVLFELHSRNQARTRNAQSEVDVRRMASSGGFEQTRDRDNSQSVDAKLSLTVGADAERRDSSFARAVQRRQVSGNNLTVIAESTEELAKSRQTGDITWREAPRQSVQSQLMRSQASLQIEEQNYAQMYDSTLEQHHNQLEETQQSEVALAPKLQHAESGDTKPLQVDKAQLVQQIRAKLRFVLPPALMQQLARTNARFFAN